MHLLLNNMFSEKKFILDQSLNLNKFLFFIIFSYQGKKTFVESILF